MFFKNFGGYPIDLIEVRWWLPGAFLRVFVHFLHVFAHFWRIPGAGVMLPGYCGLRLGFWSAGLIVRFLGVIVGKGGVEFLTNAAS